MAARSGNAAQYLVAGAGRDFSETGILLYVTKQAEGGTPVWVDRSGAARESDPDWSDFVTQFELSPDGTISETLTVRRKAFEEWGHRSSRATAPYQASSRCSLSTPARIT